MLTESGVSANVRAVGKLAGLGPSDRAVVFSPPAYSCSLSVNLTHASVGGSLVPMADGLRFPIELVETIERYRCTGLAAVPTALQLIHRTAGAGSFDLGCVRYLMSVGQPLDVDLVARVQNFFPNAAIINMYGCTENSPRISGQRIDQRTRPTAHGVYPVGRALDGIEISIHQSSGEPVGPTETGEVWIGGTSLMRGYWRDLALTSKHLVDGSFRTEDLGFLTEDGSLYLVGRSNSIINVGNQKVSPEEVERVLESDTRVVEAGVYGVPDDLLGERPAAQVVLEPGVGWDEKALRRACRKQLSAYKVPRSIVVVDSLPRTDYGKIDRKRLGEES